ARTARGVENLKMKVGWPALFAETGIQFMPINTIYQLAAESPERLRRTRNWSSKLIAALQMLPSLFTSIVPSGTRLGRLKPDLAVEGLTDVQVFASCSHDTGAAVAAVPAKNKSWAYISSGTWSLMGVERSEPVLTEL